MEMMLDELIKEFKELDCEEYESWRGKHCYRVVLPLPFFFDYCRKLGIESKWTGDFLHEAKGNGFELSWCEEDITLAID